MNDPIVKGRITILSNIYDGIYFCKDFHHRYLIGPSNVNLRSCFCALIYPEENLIAAKN